METKTLEQIGLTKSEIKAYFALLELGSSSVGPILEKSKVPSSKIYLLLNRLVNKGLASFTEKGNVKYYIAESPNRILDFIDEKKQELDKEKNDIQKIIPSLIAKRKEISENKAKVFEGRRGIYSAYEDIIETLKKGEEMHYFSLGQENFEELWVRNFFKEFADKRKAKGIMSKGIYPKALKSTIQKNFQNQPLHKLKFIDFAMPTGIVIYDSKVLLLDWKNLIVFMICSKEISDSYRMMFKKLWK